MRLVIGGKISSWIFRWKWLIRKIHDGKNIKDGGRKEYDDDDDDDSINKTDENNG